MSQSHREEVRDLLRRIDDVRGLSESSQRGPIDPGDPSDWMRTTAELVDELERSHRRLIETNVQLVSLREVASSMVTATDASETTRTVTRYLARAFGFGDAFLLLVDRERGTLAGTWTHGVGEGERTFRLELPLLGDRGGVTRSLWLNRTVLLRDPERHPSPVCRCSAATRGSPSPMSCVGHGASWGMYRCWRRPRGRPPRAGRSIATSARGTALPASSCRSWA